VSHGFGGVGTAPLELAAAPDLLIVPSRLQPCVRTVGRTVCVNPGRLTTGHAGGTFARVVVLPVVAGTPRAEAPARMRVDIVRI
jgi:DNA polymerase alpha subunit B